MKRRTKATNLNAAKINTFIRENFNRLLLLAVLLSGCFALRFAAYGKYVEMVYDYTSARAGNFYFTSNYLSAPEDHTNYTIGSFDGSKYQVDLEIRNYDNSFNFNREGVDFYYYITAEVFEDSAMTIPATGFTTSIAYDVQGKLDAAKVRMVKSSTGKDGMKNPIIDNTTDARNDETAYKPLGLLKGYGTDGSVDDSGKERGTAAVRTYGKQVCTVTLRWTNPVQGKVYLKLSAHTVPPTKTSEEPTDDKLIIEPSDRIGAQPLLENYEDMKGVYESEINAVFILNADSSGSGEIRAERQVNSSDYLVTYRLSCGVTALTKVYYNPEKLSPDASLEPVKEDPEKPTLRYIDLRIPANGSVTCYFYRKSLSTPIGPEASDDDLFFTQTEEEQVAPEQDQNNEPEPEP